MNNASPSAVPHDPYAVFRIRDFRLYLTGRLVSATGQQMFGMAIGWELYERTGSALALGMVGLTQVLPMYLFTLPAGHVADSYNRKKIILLMTFVVALANLGLTAVSALGAPVGWFYVCLFAASSARTFLMAASASFMPQLVPRKIFSHAVTWNVSVFQTASIIGPLLAGMVIGHLHHAAWVYALNTLAALVFCGLLARVDYRQPATTPQEMTFQTLLNGFRFVFSTRIILGLITLDMFAVLLGGATALLPIYAKDILFVGPTGLGMLQAALPFGSVCCAFVVAHRRPMLRAGHAMLWAVMVFGVATIAFGLSQWFWVSIAMLFACGCADNVSVVVRHTLVQMLTPDEKRGRVSAVNNLFIGTSNELGEAESGAVAHLYGQFIGNTAATGAMIAAVSGGIGTIYVVVVVALMWPEIRKYGRLDGGVKTVDDVTEIRPSQPGNALE